MSASIPKQVADVLKKWLFFIVLLFGYPMFLGIQAAWESYWLSKDGKQTMAVIVNDEHGHDVVDYKYTVDFKEYTGAAQRGWEHSEYQNVQVGEQAPVFFSTSHPWISSVDKPTFPPFDFFWAFSGPFLILVISLITWRRNSDPPSLENRKP